MNGIGDFSACSLTEKEALPAFLIRHGRLKIRSATSIRREIFTRFSEQTPG